MMPDRAYRRSTRRLYGACVVVAAGLVVLAGLLFQRFPVAGVFLCLMAIGALRLAREVRDEIEGWDRSDWCDVVPSSSNTPYRIEYRLDGRFVHVRTRPAPSTLDVDEDGYLWLGGIIVGKADR